MSWDVNLSRHNSSSAQHGWRLSPNRCRYCRWPPHYTVQYIFVVYHMFPQRSLLSQWCTPPKIEVLHHAQWPLSWFLLNNLKRILHIRSLHDPSVIEGGRETYRFIQNKYYALLHAYQLTVRVQSLASKVHDFLNFIYFYHRYYHTMLKLMLYSHTDR